MAVVLDILVSNLPPLQATIAAARVYTLCAGVRGKNGILFLSPWLCAANLCLRFAGPEEEVQKLLDELWAIVPVDNRWSLGHNEQRHRLMSGIPFLECVRCNVGALISAAAEFQCIFDYIVTAPAPTDLPLHVLRKVLSAADGRLCLCFRDNPADTSKPIVAYARDYNAMDKGRVLIAFYYFRLGVAPPPLPQKLFSEVVAMQSKADGPINCPIRWAGLENVIDFNNFIQDVNTGLLPSSPTDLHTKTGWPFVFAFLCETKQSVNSIGLSCVANILSRASEPSVRELVIAKHKDLLAKSTNGNQCHLATLLRTAADALGIEVGAQPEGSTVATKKVTKKKQPMRRAVNTKGCVQELALQGWQCHAPYLLCTPLRHSKRRKKPSLTIVKPKQQKRKWR